MRGREEVREGGTEGGAGQRLSGVSDIRSQHVEAQLGVLQEVFSPLVGWCVDGNACRGSWLGLGCCR